MKVIIINLDDKPEFVGGIKRVCLMLAKQWEKDGITVKFLCFCNSPNKYHSLDGIQQLFFPEPKEYFSSKNILFLKEFYAKEKMDIILNPFCENIQINHLLGKMRRESPIFVVNALHFSPLHLMQTYQYNFFIKWKLGFSVWKWAKEVIFYANFLFRGRKKVETKARVSLESAFASADAFVTLSQRFTPGICQLLNKEIQDIISIPNPIECITNEIHIQKKKSILWIGRVEFGTKRVDRMLKIWKIVQKRFHDWELKIVGSGESKPFMEMCDLYGVHNVSFLGFRNDLSSLYRDSSVVCCTSNDEGWGMTIVEGMQYGCVPIAFGSYLSIHDIITDGYNGYIIPPFNEVSFAERICQIIENTELREKIGNAARKSIQRFSLPSISLRWIDLFYKLLMATHN